MTEAFPRERATKRQFLLDAVDSISETLRASGARSEESARLAPEAVDALVRTGMFSLKLAEEMGGAEADPITEMLVLEALAYHDLTSGWCTMVGATAIASLGHSCRRPGWKRYSRTDRCRRPRSRSFQPAVPCAMATVIESTAAGGSTAAFATRNGCSAARLSKEARARPADRRWSCSPPSRSRTSPSTTIGEAWSAFEARAPATSRSRTIIYRKI